MLYQIDEILSWCQQKSGLRGARCWHQRGNMPNWCQHWPRFTQSSIRKGREMMQHGTWKSLQIHARSSHQYKKREEMIQQVRRDEDHSPDKPRHQYAKEREWYSMALQIRDALQTACAEFCRVCQVLPPAPSSKSFIELAADRADGTSAAPLTFLQSGNKL